MLIRFFFTSFISYRCLRYMGDYTNCLLKGYGVLPSSPTHVHVTNIDTEFAILQWSSPKTLADTVLYYNVHYRMYTRYDNEYQIIRKVQSPYILENLESYTGYEFYIEAVNTHGIGDRSPRILFLTSSKVSQIIFFPFFRFFFFILSKTKFC